MEPIIILGNSRSGTTLLRLILTCHSNISIPPEGPFFFYLEPKYWKVNTLDNKLIQNFVDDLWSVPKIEEWNLNRDRLINRLKNSQATSFLDLVDAVHFEYMDTQGLQKKRWGDKSGSYSIWRLGSIRRSLPHAHLIHIVRDGRDVACSYRSISGVTGKYAPNLPTNILEIAFQWDHNVQRIHRFINTWPEKKHSIVKYEDLVNEPEFEIKKLCEDIGEEFESEMLDFYLSNKKFKLEPEIFLGWKEKTQSPITSTQVGQWKNGLSMNEQVLFVTLAGDTLRLHEYLSEDYDLQPTFYSRVKVNLFEFKRQIEKIFGIGRSLFRLKID